MVRHDWGLLAQQRLRKKLESISSADDYCVARFRFLIQRLKPTDSLIEKTPTNIYHVPTIKRLFPDAKIIAIFRDGRDVVISDMHHRLRANGQNVSFQDRTRNWCQAMEAQLLCENQYDLLSISYESLLSDPHNTLNKIMTHLELPHDASLQNDMIKRSSFEFVTDRKSGQENTTTFYRKGAKGDWINIFTEEETRTFSGLAGEVLVKLGYEQSADPVTW